MNLKILLNVKLFLIIINYLNSVDILNREDTYCNENNLSDLICIPRYDISNIIDKVIEENFKEIDLENLEPLIIYNKLDFIRNPLYSCSHQKSKLIQLDPRHKTFICVHIVEVEKALQCGSGYTLTEVLVENPNNILGYTKSEIRNRNYIEKKYAIKSDKLCIRTVQVPVNITCTEGYLKDGFCVEDITFTPLYNCPNGFHVTPKKWCGYLKKDLGETLVENIIKRTNPGCVIKTVHPWFKSTARVECYDNKRYIVGITEDDWVNVLPATIKCPPGFEIVYPKYSTEEEIKGNIVFPPICLSRKYFPRELICAGRLLRNGLLVTDRSIIEKEINPTPFKQHIDLSNYTCQIQDRMKPSIVCPFYTDEIIKERNKHSANISNEINNLTEQVLKYQSGMTDFITYSNFLKNNNIYNEYLIEDQNENVTNSTNSTMKFYNNSNYIHEFHVFDINNDDIGSHLRSANNFDEESAFYPFKINMTLENPWNNNFYKKYNSLRRVNNSYNNRQYFHENNHEQNYKYKNFEHKYNIHDNNQYNYLENHLHEENQNNEYYSSKYNYQKNNPYTFNIDEHNNYNNYNNYHQFSKHNHENIHNHFKKLNFHDNYNDIYHFKKYYRKYQSNLKYENTGEYYNDYQWNFLSKFFKVYVSDQYKFISNIPVSSISHKALTIDGQYFLNVNLDPTYQSFINFTMDKINNNHFEEELVDFFLNSSNQTNSDNMMENDDILNSSNIKNNSNDDKNKFIHEIIDNITDFIKIKNISEFLSHIIYNFTDSIEINNTNKSIIQLNNKMNSFEKNNTDNLIFYLINLIKDLIGKNITNISENVLNFINQNFNQSNYTIQDINELNSTIQNFNESNSKIQNFNDSISYKKIFNESNYITQDFGENNFINESDSSINEIKKDKLIENELQKVNSSEIIDFNLNNTFNLRYTANSDFNEKNITNSEIHKLNLTSYDIDELNSTNSEFNNKNTTSSEANNKNTTSSEVNNEITTNSDIDELNSTNYDIDELNSTNELKNIFNFNNIDLEAVKEVNPLTIKKTFLENEKHEYNNWEKSARVYYMNLDLMKRNQILYSTINHYSRKKRYPYIYYSGQPVIENYYGHVRIPAISDHKYRFGSPSEDYYKYTGRYEKTEIAYYIHKYFNYTKRYRHSPGPNNYYNCISINESVPIIECSNQSIIIPRCFILDIIYIKMVNFLNSRFSQDNSTDSICEECTELNITQLETENQLETK